MDNWTAAWGMDLTLAGCEHCDWLFVLPPQQLPLSCPHCARQELTPLDETVNKPIYTQPPELILPFNLDPAAAQGKLTAFSKKLWLAPPDLKAKHLHDRLRPIFLPMWLVDARVQARWQAEMGFDYDVVSHKEDYRNGRWHTREVKETRIRWEPRLGTLQREYHNKHAPALEEQAAIERNLGQLNLRPLQTYEPHTIQEAMVRLPNRDPDDAWSDAEIAFKQAAGDECKEAAAAEHIRQYKWQPDFSQKNWTQLLYPIYTSYYQDEDGQFHIIYLNGQTGRLSGVHKASMKRARYWSTAVGIVAAGIMALSFLLFIMGYFLSDWYFSLAGLFLVIGLFSAFSALIPILYAWSKNQAAKAAQELNLT